MARPKKCRRVCARPAVAEFLPRCGRKITEAVRLGVDEYEAIRLIDYEGLSQEDCGRHMGIARTTVQEIYTTARRKLAEALVEGCVLIIEGGDYRLCNGDGGPCAHGGCIRNVEKNEITTDKGGNKMRIAVTHEKGQVFQHFGHTKEFKIYMIEDGKILFSTVVSSEGSGHGALAGMLKSMHVDALICGGIGGGAQAALAEAGIRLYGGVTGGTDEAVQALLEDRLDFDPNAKCDHHDEHHHDHECGEHGCGSHGCGH